MTSEKSGRFNGVAVLPEQAAEALLNALALRGVLAERRTGERGPQVVLPSGLTIGIEADCYSWPVGSGLQIHPLNNAEGAATLIAEQENDPVWRLRRLHPGWLIMQPIPGSFIAVPASRRLWHLTVVHAASAEDLIATLERVEAQSPPRT
jgi:hypothetical protein